MVAAHRRSSSYRAHHIKLINNNLNSLRGFAIDKESVYIAQLTDGSMAIDNHEDFFGYSTDITNEYIFTPELLSAIGTSSLITVRPVSRNDG